MFFNHYSEIEEFLDSLPYSPAIHSLYPPHQDKYSAINSDLNKLGIDAMKLSSDFAHAKVKIVDEDISSESTQRTGRTS